MNIRAAMHVHSNWSYDGSWELRDLARFFKRHRFRVVFISEHDRGFSNDRLERHREACAEASDSEILLIPGVEYSDAENVVHITTWGATSFLGEAQPTKKILERVAELGGFAGFAHPSRREAWRRWTDDWRDLLGGIELWNRKTDGWAPSREALSLVEAMHLPPLAAMDFHTIRQWFPLSLRVEAPEVSELHMIRSLRERQFLAEAFGGSLHGNSRPLLMATLAAVESARRKLAMAIRGVPPLTKVPH